MCWDDSFQKKKISKYEKYFKELYFVLVNGTEISIKDATEKNAWFSYMSASFGGSSAPIERTWI